MVKNLSPDILSSLQEILFLTRSFHTINSKRYLWRYPSERRDELSCSLHSVGNVPCNRNVIEGYLITSRIIDHFRRREIMSNNINDRGLLVDWRAAIYAGLIAGTLFLVLNLFLLPVMIDGDTTLMIRYIASIVLGKEALSPDHAVGGGMIAAALAIQYVLSILFTMIIAFVVHRGGVVAGAIGGVLLGSALYSINLYTFTLFFPWFFALEGGLFLIAHAIFGGVAGTMYELLEREELEVLQGEKVPEIHNHY